MKLQLKDLEQNPYKKEISDGKLNQEQVDKIKANIKKLGLMGSIPIRKFKGKYQLVSHHHRLEALKQLHGKDFKVEVVIHDYDDEQMLRGMVIENITQRTGEFREETENVVVVRKYLNDNNDKLLSLRESRKHQEKLNIRYKEKPTTEDIARWIDPEYKVMSHDKVNQLLNIKDKLDPELQIRVEKTHKGSAEKRTDEKVISFIQAEMLSKIENRQEQRDLAKSLSKTEEVRVREQGKDLSAYKLLPKKIKEEIRKGKLDLHTSPRILRVIEEVPDKIKQVKIIERIKKNGLNEEQLGDLIKKNQNNKDFIPLKDQLSEDLFKEDWWLPEQKRPQGYGRNDYHGNCSPLLIKQGLLRYAKKKSCVIVDSMAGSGTFIDVAKEMKYKNIHAFDIYPIREDIKKKSAQDTGLKNNSVDFIFNHYPYWEMVDYSKYSNKKSPDDLSNLKYEEFLKECKKIIQHNFNILKKDNYYMVLIGDIRRSGRKFLASKVSEIAEEIGFKLWDRAVMKLQGQTIKADPKAYYRALKNNYMVQTFDDVLVFKK